MIPLPERPVHLWGTEHQVIPYLIEAIHGNGQKWLWFGYMDDRPWFYVARVDSSVVANNNNEKWSDEVLPWIEDQIEDEMMEFMTEEQCDQWREQGYLDGDRPWPIPPLEMPCGSEWGWYRPSEEDLGAASVGGEGVASVSSEEKP